MNAKKLISVATALCFLFSFVFAPAAQAVVETRRSIKEFKAILDDFVIPASIGRVTGSYSPEGFANAPRVVINIQDLHCNGEVQKNIAGILKLIDSKYKLSKVYVEGASGQLDTSWLVNIPDTKLRKALVEKMVDQGHLTGTEYFAALSGKKDILSGIEDEKLYRENYVRLGVILGNKAKYSGLSQSMQKDLDKLKEAYFSTSNKRLEKTIAMYKARELDAAKYYKILLKFAGKLDTDSGRFNALAAGSPNTYPAITGYIGLMEDGKNLKYQNIARQLQEFMRILKQKLPESAYNLLLEKTDNLTKLDELYIYLSRISSEYKLDLSVNFPQLATFLTYLSNSQGINPNELVKQEKRLIENIRTGLSRNQAELEVSFLSDFFSYFDDYLNNKLTSEDYVYFSKRSGEFKELWTKYTGNDRFNGMKADFDMLAEYYGVNFQRNDSFMRNINIDHIANGTNSRAADTAPGNSSTAGAGLSGIPANSEVVVIVAGGFHTGGIETLLAGKKIPYITITPNVTGETKTADAVYQEIVKQQAKILAQAFANMPMTELIRRTNNASETGKVEILEGVLKDLLNAGLTGSNPEEAKKLLAAVLLKFNPERIEVRPDRVVVKCAGMNEVVFVIRDGVALLSGEKAEAAPAEGAAQAQVPGLVRVSGDAAVTAVDDALKTLQSVTQAVEALYDAVVIGVNAKSRPGGVIAPLASVPEENQNLPGLNPVVITNEGGKKVVRFNKEIMSRLPAAVQTALLDNAEALDKLLTSPGETADGKLLAAISAANPWLGELIHSFAKVSKPAAGETPKAATAVASAIAEHQAAVREVKPAASAAEPASENNFRERKTEEAPVRPAVATKPVVSAPKAAPSTPATQNAPQPGTPEENNWNRRVTSTLDPDLSLEVIGVLNDNPQFKFVREFDENDRSVQVRKVADNTFIIRNFSSQAVKVSYATNDNVKVFYTDAENRVYGRLALGSTLNAEINEGTPVRIETGRYTLTNMPNWALSVPQDRIYKFNENRKETDGERLERLNKETGYETYEIVVKGRALIIKDKNGKVIQTFAADAGGRFVFDFRGIHYSVSLNKNGKYAFDATNEHSAKVWCVDYPVVYYSPDGSSGTRSLLAGEGLIDSGMTYSFYDKNKNIIRFSIDKKDNHLQMKYTENDDGKIKTADFFNAEGILFGFLVTQDKEGRIRIINIDNNGNGNGRPLRYDAGRLPEPAKSVSTGAALTKADSRWIENTLRRLGWMTAEKGVIPAVVRALDEIFSAPILERGDITGIINGADRQAFLDAHLTDAERKQMTKEAENRQTERATRLDWIVKIAGNSVLRYLHVSTPVNIAVHSAVNLLNVIVRVLISIGIKKELLPEGLSTDAPLAAAPYASVQNNPWAWADNAAGLNQVPDDHMVRQRAIIIDAILRSLKPEEQQLIILMVGLSHGNNTGIASSLSLAQQFWERSRSVKYDLDAGKLIEFLELSAKQRTSLKDVVELTLNGPYSYYKYILDQLCTPEKIRKMQDAAGILPLESPAAAPIPVNVRPVENAVETPVSQAVPHAPALEPSQEFFTADEIRLIVFMMKFQEVQSIKNKDMNEKRNIFMAWVQNGWELDVSLGITEKIAHDFITLQNNSAYQAQITTLLTRLGKGNLLVMAQELLTTSGVNRLKEAAAGIRAREKVLQEFKNDVATVGLDNVVSYGAATFRDLFNLDRGLMPSHKFSVESGEVFYVSDPFVDPTSQKTVFLVYLKHIPKDGTAPQIFVNAYYRSDSQNVWRAASHQGVGENAWWIGKGYDEQYQTLPSAVQEKLEGLKNSAAAIPTKEGFYKVLGLGEEHPYDPAIMQSVMLSQIKNIVNPIGLSKSLFQTPQYERGLRPDFTSCRTYETQSLLYGGKVTTYVVSSEDGAVEYLFNVAVVNGVTKVWIGGLQYAHPKLTRQGIPSVPINAPWFYMTPAFEYASNIETLKTKMGVDLSSYMRPQNIYRPEKYIDMSSFLDQLPIIKDFRAQVLNERPAVPVEDFDKTRMFNIADFAGYNRGKQPLNVSVSGRRAMAWTLTAAAVLAVGTLAFFGVGWFLGPLLIVKGLSTIALTSGILIGSMAGILVYNTNIYSLDAREMRKAMSPRAPPASAEQIKTLESLVADALNNNSGVIIEYYDPENYQSHKNLVMKGPMATLPDGTIVINKNAVALLVSPELPPEQQERVRRFLQHELWHSYIANPGKAPAQQRLFRTLSALSKAPLIGRVIEEFAVSILEQWPAGKLQIRPLSDASPAAKQLTWLSYTLLTGVYILNAQHFHIPQLEWASIALFVALDINGFFDYVFNKKVGFHFNTRSIMNITLSLSALGMLGLQIFNVPFLDISNQILLWLYISKSFILPALQNRALNKSVARAGSLEVPSASLTSGEGIALTLPENAGFVEDLRHQGKRANIAIHARNNLKFKNASLTMPAVLESGAEALKADEINSTHGYIDGLIEGLDFKFTAAEKLEIKLKARSAFDAMAAAGAVTAGNIEEIKNLFATISGNSRGRIGESYAELRALAESAVSLPDNIKASVLNLELLTVIAAKTGIFCNTSYSALKALAASAAALPADVGGSVMDTELLTGIAGKTGRTSGAAFSALNALAGAGVITNNNGSEIGKLFSSIAGRNGEDIDYAALKALAESSKAMPVDVKAAVLNVELLTAIAVRSKFSSLSVCFSALQSLAETTAALDEGTRKEALNGELLTALSEFPVSYHALGALAKAGVVTKAGRKAVEKLFILIAEKNSKGWDTSSSYDALKSLADAAAKLPAAQRGSVLDVTLLAAMTEQAGGFTKTAYSALQSLAEANLPQDVQSAVLNLRLLTAVAKKSVWRGPDWNSVIKSMRAMETETVEQPDEATDGFTALRSLALAAAGLDVNTRKAVLDSAFLEESAGFAPESYSAFKALILAGAVKIDNVKNIKDLLTATAGKNGDFARAAYAALNSLTSAGAVSPDNIEAVKSLFTAIPGKAGVNSFHAYSTLEFLAGLGAVTKDNINTIEKLFTGSARISGEDPGYGARVLHNAAESGLLNKLMRVNKLTLNRQEAGIEGQQVGGILLEEFSGFSQLAAATGEDIELPELSGELVLPEEQKYKTAGLEEKSVEEIFNDLGITGATYAATLGRKVTYKYTARNGDKKRITFKMQKEGEDAGILAREGDNLNLLERARTIMRRQGDQLLGDYPVPVGVYKVNGIKDNQRVSNTGAPIALAAKDGVFTALVLIEDDETLTYLDGGQDGCRVGEVDGSGKYKPGEKITDKEVEAAVRNNVHDLFTLLKYGIVHPDLISMFHEGRLEEQARRPTGDMGFYRWKRGGRMGSPLFYAMFSNFRLSGPCDWANLTTVNDIAGKKYMPQFFAALGISGASKTEIMHTMIGNYWLQLSLVTLAWMNKTGRLEYNGENIKWLQGTMEKMFKESTGILRGKAGAFDVNAVVDSGLMARQMLYFMSGEYAKDLPFTDEGRKLSGKNDLSVEENAKVEAYQRIQSMFLGAKLKLPSADELKYQKLPWGGYIDKAGRFIGKTVQSMDDVFYLDLGVPDAKTTFTELLKAQFVLGVLSMRAMKPALKVPELARAMRAGGALTLPENAGFVKKLRSELEAQGLPEEQIAGIIAFAVAEKEYVDSLHPLDFYRRHYEGAGAYKGGKPSRIAGIAAITAGMWAARSISFVFNLGRGLEAAKQLSEAAGKRANISIHARYNLKFKTAPLTLEGPEDFIEIRSLDSRQLISEAVNLERTAREQFINQDREFVNTLERSGNRFGEVAATFLSELNRTNDLDLALREMGFEGAARAVKEGFKRLADFAGTEPGAGLAEALGKAQAIRDVTYAVQTQQLRKILPGNRNTSPSASNKPYFDYAAGTNPIVYFNKLLKNRQYVFVDNDAFAASYLSRAAEILGLQNNVKAVREDIFALRHLPESIGTLRMKNVGTYVDVNNIPDSWYDETGEAVSPGGQIIVEFRPNRAAGQENNPIIRKFRDRLVTNQPGRWTLEYGHFDNDGRFIANEAGSEVPGLYSINTVVIFTKSEASNLAATPGEEGTISIQGFLGNKLAAIKGNLAFGPNDFQTRDTKVPGLTRTVLENLYNIAVLHHQGQFRKDGQTSYLAHILGVTSILVDTLGINDAEAIAAAFLHDTLEDSIEYYQELAKTKYPGRIFDIEKRTVEGVAAETFKAQVIREIIPSMREKVFEGIAARLEGSGLNTALIKQLVFSLSKVEGVSTADYLEGIRNAGRLAVAVKVADLTYNLRDLKKTELEGFVDKYLFDENEGRVWEYFKRNDNGAAFVDTLLAGQPDLARALRIEVLSSIYGVWERSNKMQSPAFARGVVAQIDPSIEIPGTLTDPGAIIEHARKVLSERKPAQQSNRRTFLAQVAALVGLQQKQRDESGVYLILDPSARYAFDPALPIQENRAAIFTQGNARTSVVIEDQCVALAISDPETGKYALIHVSPWKAEHERFNEAETEVIVRNIVKMLASSGMKPENLTVHAFSAENVNHVKILIPALKKVFAGVDEHNYHQPYISVRVFPDRNLAVANTENTFSDSVNLNEKHSGGWSALAYVAVAGVVALWKRKQSQAENTEPAISWGTTPLQPASAQILQAVPRVSKDPRMEIYCSRPKVAVYPGGLDLKIFSIFPNLRKAVFINKQPFRTEYSVNGLSFEGARGAAALGLMKKKYLSQARNGFIWSNLQNGIANSNVGAVTAQVGFEDFIKADIAQTFGIEEDAIDVKDASVGNLPVYEITFADRGGNIREIVYVQSDVATKGYLAALKDYLFDLIYFKATDLKKENPIPEELFRMLKTRGLYVDEYYTNTEYGIARVKDLFSRLKRVGEIGGDDTQIGPLGHIKSQDVLELQPADIEVPVFSAISIGIEEFLKAPGLSNIENLADLSAAIVKRFSGTNGSNLIEGSRFREEIDTLNKAFGKHGREIKVKVSNSAEVFARDGKGQACGIPAFLTTEDGMTVLYIHQEFLSALTARSRAAGEVFDSTHGPGTLAELFAAEELAELDGLGSQAGATVEDYVNYHKAGNHPHNLQLLEIAKDALGALNHNASSISSSAKSSKPNAVNSVAGALGELFKDGTNKIYSYEVGERMPFPVIELNNPETEQRVRTIQAAKTRFEEFYRGLLRDLPVEIYGSQNHDILNFMIRETLQNAFDNIIACYDPEVNENQEGLKDFSGIISVEFNLSETQLTIRITDNGIGLATGIGDRKTRLMGNPRLADNDPFQRDWGIYFGGYGASGMIIDNQLGRVNIQRKIERGQFLGTPTLRTVNIPLSSLMVKPGTGGFSAISIGVEQVLKKTGLTALDELGYLALLFEEWFTGKDHKHVVIPAPGSELEAQSNQLKQAFEERIKDKEFEIKISKSPDVFTRDGKGEICGVPSFLVLENGKYTLYIHQGFLEALANEVARKRTEYESIHGPGGLLGEFAKEELDELEYFSKLKQDLNREPNLEDYRQRHLASPHNDKLIEIAKKTSAEQLSMHMFLDLTKDESELVNAAMGYFTRSASVKEQLVKLGVRFARSKLPANEANIEKNCIYIGGDAHEIAKQIAGLINLNFLPAVKAEHVSTIIVDGDTVREELADESPEIIAREQYLLQKYFYGEKLFKLIDLLRFSSGEENLTIDDLSKEISFRHYASGSNKHVYLVSFFKNDGSVIPMAHAIFKQEKQGGTITQVELHDTSLVGSAGLDCVPHFGASDDEDHDYIEEFVPGKTAYELLKSGRLEKDMRARVVEVILLVGRELGKIPEDMHGKNFIIDERDAKRVVFVDLGFRRIDFDIKDMKSALSLLTRLVGYYGYAPSEGESNDFVFEKILSYMPNNGEQVLMMARAYARVIIANARKSGEPVTVAGASDRHVGWIKDEKDLGELVKQIDNYLQKKKSGNPEAVAIIERPSGALAKISPAALVSVRPDVTPAAGIANPIAAIKRLAGYAERTALSEKGVLAGKTIFIAGDNTEDAARLNKEGAESVLIGTNFDLQTMQAPVTTSINGRDVTITYGTTVSGLKALKVSGIDAADLPAMLPEIIGDIEVGRFLRDSGLSPAVLIADAPAFNAIAEARMTGAAAPGVVLIAKGDADGLSSRALQLVNAAIGPQENIDPGMLGELIKEKTKENFSRGHYVIVSLDAARQGVTEDYFTRIAEGLSENSGGGSVLMEGFEKLPADRQEKLISLFEKYQISVHTSLTASNLAGLSQGAMRRLANSRTSGVEIDLSAIAAGAQEVCGQLNAAARAFPDAVIAVTLPKGMTEADRANLDQNIKIIENVNISDTGEVIGDLSGIQSNPGRFIVKLSVSSRFKESRGIAGYHLDRIVQSIQGSAYIISVEDLAGAVDANSLIKLDMLAAQYKALKSIIAETPEKTYALGLSYTGDELLSGKDIGRLLEALDKAGVKDSLSKAPGELETLLEQKTIPGEIRNLARELAEKNPGPALLKISALADEAIKPGEGQKAGKAKLIAFIKGIAEASLLKENFEGNGKPDGLVNRTDERQLGRLLLKGLLELDRIDTAYKQEDGAGLAARAGILLALGRYKEAKVLIKSLGGKGTANSIEAASKFISLLAYCDRLDVRLETGDGISELIKPNLGSLEKGTGIDRIYYYVAAKQMIAAGLLKGQVPEFSEAEMQKQALAELADSRTTSARLPVLLEALQFMPNEEIAQAMQSGISRLRNDSREESLVFTDELRILDIYAERRLKSTVKQVGNAGTNALEALLGAG